MDTQDSILAEKAQRARGVVHRPSDASASSSQPPAADVQDDSVEDHVASSSQPVQLPPYSSTSSNPPDQQKVFVAKGPQYYPGLPVLDYRQYSPPMFDLSVDTTTITSKATYLSENVKALSTLLTNLATVPPKPQVSITGNRGRKVDFSIKLNLLSLLIPDNPNNRMDYLRLINKDEMGYRGGQQPSLKPEVTDGGLEAWCQRFIDDDANVKSFMLERVVANFDTNWLEGQIRSLVATTQYKGVVTVSFPVTHSKVIVQTPDKVNKFFTSVSTLFTGKSKYEVVKAVWPFATAKNGEPGRRCLVQSEKTWWEEWKDPIKYAVATKRHGWVTNEDKLECIMESKGKGLSIVDWGPDF
ncbi:hypothetical protein BKA67DRAFT_545056 [Truncatella angustata]|uniref:Uncharacterized protein n=1 Tax=Truncatella angustata TaxID=152316 RepID=A0A9P8UWF0_9PEZI|nr:uncharacterized protein BKA67DRAFT_545056 [Truncatella angustata]KAH6659605.1 hypothetical protein BKA67DRAFT_545056 [Truncatella angustata]KAH8198136.1 hypothetical protein TruAng_007713 [Truncatella angustata]